MGLRALRERASLAVRRTRATVRAATGATERAFASRSGSAAILMYHRVLPDDHPAHGIYPGMFVRRSSFDRQVRWLASRFQIRTLGDLLARPPATDDPPLAALTFDDGFRDNLTEAWPVLEQHGVRATIFLVANWVRDGANARGEFLRPEDVARLAAAGMEFGAHTANHVKLDRVLAGEAIREMEASRADVASWTGRPCELFAYPLGLRSPAAVAAARGLFRGSVIVGGGWWTPGLDPASIPRIGVHEDVASDEKLFSSLIAFSDGGRRP